MEKYVEAFGSWVFGTALRKSGPVAGITESVVDAMVGLRLCDHDGMQGIPFQTCVTTWCIHHFEPKEKPKARE